MKETATSAQSSESFGYMKATAAAKAGYTECSLKPASAKLMSQDLSQCLSPVKLEATLTGSFTLTASSR